jgi:glycosyltransferase involved in cell wall biosynthesis
MESKPKPVILLFIDWFLPGYKAGGPVTSCSNLIEHLRDEFEFKIVTRNTDYTETTPYEGIESNVWNKREEGVFVYYFSQDQLNKKNLKRLIAETPHDRVYLNGIYSRYFTLYPLLILNKHRETVIVAVRGMLAESAIAVKKRKKTFFIRIARFLGLFKNIIFHATNQQEVEDIKKQFGSGSNVLLAANLAPIPNFKENGNRVKKEGVLSLISIARIAPEKNLLYALEVLTQVKGYEVYFDVYGPKYDIVYAKECEVMATRLPENIHVNFWGSIPPEKVADLLDKSHFLWMPTRGENFGHIILQSWSAGCPVIISDQTPWHNLEKELLGWDLPLKNREVFATVIKTCAAMGQDRYNQLSNASFRFASQRTKDAQLIEDNRRLFKG